MVNKPDIISRKHVVDIAKGENNPRNSEGDFALLKSGDILFVYSRYTGDDNGDDAPCDLAALISHDGGNSFEPAGIIVKASEHGQQNIMSVSLLRLDNGDLCLFYLCKRGLSSAYYLRRADRSDETKFLSPETVIDYSEDYYFVVNNCRVLKSSDGRLFVPAAHHPIISDSGKRHSVYYSESVIFQGDECGRNWRPFHEGKLKLLQRGYSETGLQEPGIVELPDGGFYAYFRTDRCFQYEAFLSSDGEILSQPVQSRFTSPESPMLIKRNPFSGKYFALWNPIPLYNGRLTPGSKWVNAGRTPFVMAQSEDGVSFSDFTVLEDEEDRGYCYPALFFLSEDEMLMSYCCGGSDDDNCLTRTRIIKLKVR